MDKLAPLVRVAHERSTGADPAHDFLHVERVAATAEALSRAEGADVEIAVGAALLHELFNYPKGHPEAHLSGERCAEEAAVVLRGLSWQEERVEQVAYAIRVHPFSRGIVPTTLEAKVLQDADRLDAIGAIGVARCFATCASLQSPFYAEEDPLCRAREPDDKRFGTDHFFKKLLKIEGLLHTATARAMAAPRVAFMLAFLAELEREIPQRR